MTVWVVVQKGDKLIRIHGVYATRELASAAVLEAQETVEGLESGWWVEKVEVTA